ncbi:MAG: Dabb family protein [Lachnospiraceae bacterium]|jgi:hypothetical protein|nr:Dabb family protein [Lachnospiraceae bacterium]
MVKHIVMFKLKEGANGKTALENAKEAQAKAISLKDTVPSVTEMEVVCNAPAADGTNYELALICSFEDMEALEAYQKHPEHVKFGAYITGLRESRACIDYEY